MTPSSSTMPRQECPYSVTIDHLFRCSIWDSTSHFWSSSFYCPTRNLACSNQVPHQLKLDHLSLTIHSFLPNTRRSQPLITNSLTGGRTAWSSTVTINQTNISARYWYDGQYVNNAKEDAAEVALQHLLTNSNSPSPISPISPQSQNSMHQGSIWGSAGAGRPQQGAFFGGREGRERAWTRGSVGTG